MFVLAPQQRGLQTSAMRTSLRGALDMGASLLVVGNGLRLLRAAKSEAK
jgi:hypothetical protein